MKDLQKIRQEIDRIDEELAALFAARMRASAEAAAYKTAQGLPLFDEDREAVVLSHWTVDLPADLRPYGEAWARQLLELSKQYQRHLTDPTA